MQCPVCHNEVATPGAEPAAFCNHCGAPLLAAVPPAASASAPLPAAPAPAYPPPPPVAAGSGLSPNAAAALSYITFIPAVLFLMVEPYNKTPLVRFHSFQSIGLNIVAVVIYVAIRILMFPFGFILFGMVHAAVTLVLFVLWLVCVLNAVKGAYFKLPIIGDFALKQAQS